MNAFPWRFALDVWFVCVAIGIIAGVAYVIMHP